MGLEALSLSAEGTFLAELLNELCERLKARYPDARVMLHMLGSHGAMLHVTVNDKCYLLEYFGTEGFGVSLVTEENSFMRGSDMAFATLPEAEQYLWHNLMKVEGNLMNLYVDSGAVEAAERFREAERIIAQEQGGFSLFGLFQEEEMGTNWNIVASAPWLDAGGAGIRQLVNLLSKAFSIKEWKIIATALTVAPSSDFVRAITRKYQFEHQVEEIGNMYVNGLYINHAFLITSNPSPMPAQVTQEPVAA